MRPIPRKRGEGTRYPWEQGADVGVFGRVGALRVAGRRSARAPGFGRGRGASGRLQGARARWRPYAPAGAAQRRPCAPAGERSSAAAALRVGRLQGARARWRPCAPGGCRGRGRGGGAARRRLCAPAGAAAALRPLERSGCSPACPRERSGGGVSPCLGGGGCRVGNGYRGGREETLA
jgi:hypothetical protein